MREARQIAMDADTRALPLGGKIALITGAASGMGAAMAVLFSRAGAPVVLADIELAKAEALAGNIRESGGNALALALDVSCMDSWAQAVERVRGWQGALHILVNNAGVNDRRGIMDSTAASWHRQMAVNLDGAFFGMRECMPLLRSSGGGSIVNVASTAGMTGHSFAAYSTSKWALRGLSRSAALEFAPLVRVNTICPGLVITDINRGQPYLEKLIQPLPLARAGHVDDVAQLALFLSGDGSAYITGQDFVIDGGATTGTVIEKASISGPTT